MLSRALILGAERGMAFIVIVCSLVIVPIAITVNTTTITTTTTITPPRHITLANPWPLPTTISIDTTVVGGTRTRRREIKESMTMRKPEWRT